MGRAVDGERRRGEVPGRELGRKGRRVRVRG